jgi:MFS family permease
MQRTAQDWIVLTQLSNHNATAVGIVMSLQFGPQVLFLPWTGYAADHFDRRKLLFATQAAMGLLALGLGLLTLSGLVQLWHVYVFAFLLGSVTAFDAPARQTFVSDLVSEADVANAVGLNSTSFNAARLVGPAVAGVLIAAIGSGWVFVLNALSFAAVLGSLTFLRKGELRTKKRPARGAGGVAEGVRYVWKRPDLLAILFLLFLFGTFGINFPIFISTMAVQVFHSGASKFGLLTSMMAVGSVSGALLSARRKDPDIVVVTVGSVVFGGGLSLAALMPSYLLFGFALILVGVAAQTVTTTCISVVQLSSETAMRGRVMALLLAITLGGTPLGAPFIGWVVDTLGARWGVGVGAAGGFAAALVGVAYLVKHRQLRVRFDGARPRFSLDQAVAVADALPMKGA